jgi:signal transduction histidine kinase
MSRLLIVDDEISLRKTIQHFLDREHHDTALAATGQMAMEMLAKEHFDIVLTDIVLPQSSGIDILKWVRRESPTTLVIMMTGAPTVETATEAVRAGAFDYLTKPVEKESILRVVGNAARVKALEDENRHYHDKLEQLVKQRTAELEDAMQKIKKAQQQLVQQERMSALTEMASGIAHDFNNVLMPISGYSELLLSSPELLDDREETLNMLKTIRLASEDAKNIVNRLRQIYKVHKTKHSSIKLQTIIEDAIAITRPKWKEEMNARGISINCICEFDDVPDIYGNSTELREAITNLLFNASDAMSRSGTITFRLYKDAAEGVTAEVADTGDGMDEETLKRCIEPFFTTKGVHGSGLGMAMVHGIMERHGGSMDISSEVGSGTTVRLNFPAANAQAETDADTHKDCDSLSPTRVLVIDDDERSREYLRIMLEKDGHHVTLSSNGKDGVTLCGQKSFDLVITDQAMPGMSGIETARQITQMKFETPIIMVSGFGDILSNAKEQPYWIDRIMSKPIDRNQLRKAMSDVIKHHK